MLYGHNTELKEISDIIKNFITFNSLLMSLITFSLYNVLKIYEHYAFFTILVRQTLFTLVSLKFDIVSSRPNSMQTLFVFLAVASSHGKSS